MYRYAADVVAHGVVVIMRRNTKGVTADALLRGGPGGTRWVPRRTLTPPDRYIFVAERRLVHRWF